MKKIVLITGNELRHDFFRRYLSLDSGFVIVRSFCEHTSDTLQSIIPPDLSSPRLAHLEMRKQSEIDFFKLFCDTIGDKSAPEHIAYGNINSAARVEEIIALQPDLVICYGSSLIRSSLIDVFEGRFINIHLGLSPFYRGAGTNFWPFVNGEPEYAGVSFMHINPGVDAGWIIHQIQAEIHAGDTIHQIGNRLIVNMAKECRKLILNFDKLEAYPPQPLGIGVERVYRKKDFTDKSVELMQQNFQQGMIRVYLEDVASGGRQLPIIQNAGLSQNMVNV